MDKLGGTDGHSAYLQILIVIDTLAMKFVENTSAKLGYIYIHIADIT
jgi:hypothetical protein